MKAYYLRPDILHALLLQAEGREVWLGHGCPRPSKAESEDELRSLIERYGADPIFPIFFSVETFRDPLKLGDKPPESLRLDWLFFLDLDAENFDKVRRATIKAGKVLQAFNIENYLVKFSGHRGFHILLPGLVFDIFSSSSEYVKGYPIIPLKVAPFLEACINEPLIKVDLSVYKPRQLYRAAYSLHESTGLVSVPIEDPKTFKVEDVRPENVKAPDDWLPRPRVGEAKELLEAVRDWWRMQPEVSGLKIIKGGEGAPSSGAYSWVEELLMRGLPDGRQRLLWLVVAPYLVNFQGLTVQEAEDRALEWLEKCQEVKAINGDVRSLVNYYCEYAARTGLRPLSLRKLMEEPQYSDLWRIIKPWFISLRGRAGFKLLRFEGEKALYEVEESIIGEAKGIYNQLISTFQKYPESKHWKKNEEKNLLLAWIGEKIIDMTLNQFNIQHVWNHPIIQDKRIKKKEKALPDFYIGDKSLDVKISTKPNPSKFYVNKRRWDEHPADIIVFLGVDESLKEGVIYGWILGGEIEKYKIKNPGHSPAYEIRMGQLQPFQKLLQTLKAGGKNETHF